MSIHRHLRKRVDEWIWSREWLLDRMTGHDPRVRLWVFDRLTHCYPEAAVQPARSLIEDEDLYLRQTATEHLGSFGDGSDCDLLYSKYTDAAPAWKGTILNALAEQEDERVLELGDELLNLEGANINLILSFVEALKRLDTKPSRERAWEMFRTTRTEAVFSSLSGYLLNTAESDAYTEIIETVLDKVAENAMIKIRHFCKCCRSALYLQDPPTSLRDVDFDQRKPDKILSNLSRNSTDGKPSTDDHPEIETALEQLSRNETLEALSSIGAWGQRMFKESRDTSEQISQRERDVFCLLRGFNDPSADLRETKVPGSPLRQLCWLGLTAWMQHHQPHPVEKLEQARNQDGFPSELYKQESPVLLDQISLLCSERNPDHEQLLEDAASSRNMFQSVKAIKILALREEERALPVLVQSLNSPHSRKHKTAARALVRWGPTSIPPIEEALCEDKLNEGLATAADVLRRIPVQESAEVFLKHFDTFVREVGLDPIVSFSTDLALPETAEKLRTYLDQNLLLVGEQLGIVCNLYNLDFPEQERIEKEMKKQSEKHQGGPETGSPFPGGAPPTPGDSPGMPPNGPPAGPDLPG